MAVLLIVLVAVMEGLVVKEAVFLGEAVCVTVPERVLEGVLVGVCVIVLVLVIVLESVLLGV